MSTTYTGNASNITAGSGVSITIPADGDALTAASVNNPGPFEHVADFSEYLDQTLAINSILTLSFCTLGLQPNTWRCVCAPGLPTGSGPEWVLVGSSGAIYTSTGRMSSWTSQTSNVGSKSLFAVASNGSLIIAVGSAMSGVSAITSSSNGTTWTSHANPGTTQTLADIAWSPTLSLWATVGGTGLLMTSPDGVTWTSRSAGVNDFQSIVWSPALSAFLAGTVGFDYYISTNGTSWTHNTTPTSTPGNLAAGASVVILPDITTSNIYYTSDGTTWNNAGVPLNGVDIVPVFTGKMFVLGSGGTYDGTYATSIDGISWKTRVANIPNGYTSSPYPMAMAVHPNGSILQWVPEFQASPFTQALYSAPWQTP